MSKCRRRTRFETRSLLMQVVLFELHEPISKALFPLLSHMSGRDSQAGSSLPHLPPRLLVIFVFVRQFLPFSRITVVGLHQAPDTVPIFLALALRKETKKEKKGRYTYRGLVPAILSRSSVSVIHPNFWAAGLRFRLAPLLGYRLSRGSSLRRHLDRSPGGIQQQSDGYRRSGL